MKIACFSVAAMDYFPQQNAYYVGGNALNQSVKIADMGFESCFLGALGNDQNGDKIYALLQRRGVDCSLVNRLVGPTACNRIVNDCAGERFGEEGAWDGGVYEEFRISARQWQSIQGWDIWSTHASCPNFQETLGRKQHNKLCVDFLHLPHFSVLEQSIAHVDIAYIGGDPSLEERLTSLSKTTQSLIVLTMGALGSICFCSGKLYRQAALPADVVDTTGCGDAFQAGFTCSYFDGASIESALLFGAQYGKSAAQHYGGTSW